MADGYYDPDFGWTETKTSGGGFDWRGLLNGATTVGVAALTGKKEDKKPKKTNLTPIFLGVGALVVVVVLVLVFKRK